MSYSGILLIILLMVSACDGEQALTVTLTGLSERAQSLAFTLTGERAGSPEPLRAVMDRAPSRLELVFAEVPPVGRYTLQVQALDGLPCSVGSGQSEPFELGGSGAEVQIQVKPLASDPCEISVELVGTGADSGRIWAARPDPEHPGLDCKVSSGICKARYKQGAAVTLHAEVLEKEAAIGEVVFGGWDVTCQGLNKECVIKVPLSTQLVNAKPIQVFAEFAELQRCNSNGLCFDRPMDGISKLWGTSAEDVWASSKSGLLHLHDKRWHVSPGAPTGILSLWGSGPRDVWAIGDDDPLKGTKAVYRWDGQWRAVPLLDKANVSFGRLGFVSGNGPEDIWFLGLDNSRVAESILIHLSYGKSMVFSGPPGYFQNDFKGFWVGRSGNVWIATNGGTIFRLDNKGNWKRWDFAVPAEEAAGKPVSYFWGFTGVNYTDHEEIWAVGYGRQHGGMTRFNVVAWHFDGQDAPPSQGWHPYMLYNLDDFGAGWGAAMSVWGAGNLVWVTGERPHLLTRSSVESPFRMNAVAMTPTDLWPVAVWGADPAHVIAAGSPGLFLHNDASDPTNPVLRQVGLFPAAPLHGVSGNNRRDVWTVGDAGTVLRWDGSNWAAVAVPPDAAALALRGVWGDGQDGAWVVGDCGIVLQCRPDAQTRTRVCKKIDTGVGANLKAVWGSPVCPVTGCEDRRVWIVGESGAALRCGTKGCERLWLPLAGQKTLNSIWGSDDNNVWVVGEAGLVLHKNGMGWEQAAPDSKLWYNDVSVSSVWVDPSGKETWIGHNVPGWDPFGDRGFDTNQLWRAKSDGAISWSLLSSNQYGFSAIWGSGSHDVWWTWASGYVVRLDSSGIHDYGQLASSLSSIWGSGPGDIWTVGSLGGRGAILRRRAP